MKGYNCHQKGNNQVGRGRLNSYRQQTGPNGKKNWPNSRSNGFGQSNRKTQNIIIGKKVSQGLRSWRGADLTMDLYIGHFDVSTTIEDVKFNLEDQQLDIVDLEELQMSHNRFKSFKLSIRKKDFEMMQSENNALSW